MANTSSSVGKRTVEEVALELLRRCSTSLPTDVVTALRSAYEREEGIAKANLGIMLENAELAERGALPLCQDTGFVIFYVGLGGDADCDLCSIEAGLKDATRRATDAGILRANMVDPISGDYLELNVGKGSPIVKYYKHSGRGIRLTALLKGAGSENCSYLHRLDPDEGVEGLVAKVVEDVAEAGAKPCPPVIVGVGIGGTSELAMELAKLALLKPLGVRSEGELGELEARILEGVNSLGIGPMGLGGRCTALAVKVETSAGHIASLRMGVDLQCWALRRASADLDPELLR